jgi:hypothetical protein
MAEILPAIFFGHGNPMNAILDNGYTEAWSRNRTDDAEAESNSVHLRPLVCFRNRSNHHHFAENHSRFRRVSARIVSSAISCAW